MWWHGLVCQFAIREQYWTVNPCVFWLFFRHFLKWNINFVGGIAFLVFFSFLLVIACHLPCLLVTQKPPHHRTFFMPPFAFFMFSFFDSVKLRGGVSLTVSGIDRLKVALKKRFIAFIGFFFLDFRDSE